MNTGRLFLGVIVVAVGIVFLLSTADVLDAGEAVGEWWPAAIVVLGVVQVLSEARVTPAAAVLTVVGAALLGVTTGLFGDDAWGLVWPVALILVGLWIMVGFGRRRSPALRARDEVNSLAVLGSAREGTSSKRFRRASATAVLGGVTLDLSEAEPVPEGATVAATAILGGVELLVPRGWVVEVRGLPLLGGWDDTTERVSASPGAPRLEVTALVVLGGIEVKHARRWAR